MELHSVEFIRPGRPAFEDSVQGASSGLFDQLLQASRAHDDHADLPVRDNHPAPQARDDRPAPPEQDDPPAATDEAARGRDTDDTDDQDRFPRAASRRDEQPPEAGTPAAADGATAPNAPPLGVPAAQGQSDTALFKGAGAAAPAGTLAPGLTDNRPAPAATAAPPASAQTSAGQVAQPPIATPAALETPRTAAKPTEAPTLSATPARPGGAPEAKAGALQDGAFVQVSWRRGAVVSRPQGTLSGSAPLTTQVLATGKPEAADGPAFIKAPQQTADALRQGAAAARSGAPKPTIAAGTSESKSKGPGAPAPGLKAITNLALTSLQPIQPAVLGVPGLPGVPVTAATTELASSQPRAATPQPSPAEQVALRIGKSAAAGQDRISIKLHPAELGRVDVRLELGEDGLVRAALVAERAETLDLLQRDARGLERALQQAGLQLDSGSLSFNLRSGEQQGEDAGETDSAAARAADAEGGSDVVQAAAPGARHDGVLDLMV